MLKPKLCCARCRAFQRSAQTADEFYAVYTWVSIPIRPKLVVNTGEDMKLIKCVIERALGIYIMDG